MSRTFRQSLKVFADRELSPAARSALLVRAARAKLAELVAAGQATPTYRRFVDGAEGAAEESAQRRILYEFSFVAEAAVFALAFLQARSPTFTGGYGANLYTVSYRDNFMVSVDGKPIPARSFVPRSVPPGAEVIIYNRAPYSRKVDVQLAGRRVLHYRVPPNLFDDAAKAVRARFGNTTKAERLYNIAFPGQYTLQKRGGKVESPALRLGRLE